MDTIKPRLDFTQEIPQEGPGQVHIDGTVGNYPQDSPVRLANYLDSRLFNEYERIFQEITTSIGDIDFSTTFPGVGIETIGEAIKRLNLELNAIKALLEGDQANTKLDTRLFGIDTGWSIAGSSSNVGTISNDYYTPGFDEFEYEPSYEIVKIDGRDIHVNGGRISLPTGEVVSLASSSISGAYTMEVPELEYVQNVSYQFGTAMTLPANDSNKIIFTDAFTDKVGVRAYLTTKPKTLVINDESIGVIDESSGSGFKGFDFIDITGTLIIPCNFVIIKGTPVDGYIDTTQATQYYLGVNSFNSAVTTIDDTIDASPNGGIGFDANDPFNNIINQLGAYKAIIDPDSGTIRANNNLVPDTDYYIYYLKPEPKVYTIGVSSLGIMNIIDASVTDSGVVVPDPNYFPLYAVKVTYEKGIFNINPNTSTGDFLTFRRVSHPLESSVGMTSFKDAVVDIRQFRQKKKPVYIPPYAPKKLLPPGSFTKTDLHGNHAKVLPMFIPIGMTKSEITRATQAGILNTTFNEDAIYNLHVNNPSIFEIGKLSFATKNYASIYGAEGLLSQGLSIEEQKAASNIVDALTGAYGLRYKIIGLVFDIEGNSTDDVVNSKLVNGKELTAIIYDTDGNIIWKAVSVDPNNVYSWNILEDALAFVDNPQDLSLTLELSEATFTSWVKLKNSYGGPLDLVQIVLTPFYSKEHTTAAGTFANFLADSHFGRTEERDGISFSADGKITVFRKIPNQLAYQDYENGEWVKRSSETTDITGSYTFGTSLTNYPRSWKVVTGLTNQYILYINDSGDQPDIYIARVSIGDPRNYNEYQVTYTPASGDIVPKWNSSNLDTSLVDIEMIVPERPKVIIPLKNLISNDLNVRVISYLDGISNIPEVKDILTEGNIDWNIWTLIGNQRTYAVDSEHTSEILNIDRLDGRILYLLSTDKVRLIYSYPRVYVNGANYLSGMGIQYMVADVPTGHWFNYSLDPKYLVYSENRRSLLTNEDLGSETSINYRNMSHSFSLWEPLSSSIATFVLALKVVQTKTDSNFVYTDSIYLDNSRTVSEGILDTGSIVDEDTNVISVRQNSGIEFVIYDGNYYNTVRYNPYTGDYNERSNVNYLPSYNQDISGLGYVLLREDNWLDNHIFQFSGSRVYSDNTHQSVARFQSLQGLIDDIASQKGQAYKVSTYNSVAYGASRKLIGNDQTSKVVYAETPANIVISSDSEILKIAGRSGSPSVSAFTNENLVSTFVTLYGPAKDTFITVVEPDVIYSSPVDVEYPNVYNKEVYIEVGSATGAGLKTSTDSLETNELELINETVHVLEHSIGPVIPGAALHSSFASDTRSLEYWTLDNSGISTTKGFQNDSWILKDSGISGLFERESYTIQLIDLAEINSFTELTNSYDDTVITLNNTINQFEPDTYLNRYSGLLIVLSEYPSNNTVVDLEIDGEISLSITPTYHKFIFNGIRVAGVMKLLFPNGITLLTTSTIKIKRNSVYDTDIVKIATDINNNIINLRFTSYNKETDYGINYKKDGYGIKLGSASLFEPVISYLNPPYKVDVGDPRTSKSYSFIGDKQIFGLATKSINKELITYIWKDWDWIKINHTLTSSKTYLQTLAREENQILITLMLTSSGQVDSHSSNINGLQTTQTDVLGISSILNGSFKASLDYQGFFGIVVTSTELKYISITFNVSNDAPYTVNNTSTNNIYTPSTPIDIASVNIFQTSSGELCAAWIEKTSSSSWTLKAALSADGNIWNVLTLDTFGDNINNAWVNDIVQIGSNLYITASWRKFVTNSYTYFKVYRSIDYVDSLSGTTWENVDELNQTEILTSGTDVTDPIAFMGHPGYLFYAATHGRQFAVKGDGVSVNSLLVSNHGYSGFTVQPFRRGSIVYFPVVGKDNSNYSDVQMEVETPSDINSRLDNKVVSLAVYDFRMRYPEPFEAKTSYIDPFNMFGVMACDKETGRFRIDSPFIPYMTSNHVVLYRNDLAEDDFKEFPSLGLSYYTNKQTYTRKSISAALNTRKFVQSIEDEFALVPRVWKTDTYYSSGTQIIYEDVVSGDGYVLFTCLTNHISGSSFTIDINSGKWRLNWSTRSYVINKQFWKGEIVQDSNSRTFIVLVETFVASGDLQADVDSGYLKRTVPTSSTAMSQGLALINL